MAMTIGALGRATNTSVETVRYYEKVGLLPKPLRTDGNYRTYGLEGLARLSFIRRARNLGFSIDQVRTLLSFSDDTARDCQGVDELARDHLREVDRKLPDLQALRRELDCLIRSCAGGTIANCRIIDALAP